MRVEAGIGADAPPLPPQFALYGLHPVARWRLRHIPGPAFHWLKGNVDEIMALGGLHAAYDAWSHAYGPLFRVFLGGQPVVVVADGSIARSVSVKHGSRPPFRGPAELVFDNPFARTASRLNASKALIASGSRIETGVRTSSPSFSARAWTGLGASAWPRPRGRGGWV